MKKIIDVIRVGRDHYELKYDELRKEYDKKRKEIEDNFKDGKLKTDELAKLKTDFLSKVEAIKNEVKPVVEEELQKEISILTARVQQMPNKDVLTALDYVYDIPLSNMEVQMLAEKYSNNNSYWESRKMAIIAQKNHCKIEIEPSADIQMEVLQKLESNFNKFIDEFDGSDNMDYGVRVLLHDNTLYKLESKLTNAFIKENINPAQNAEIAVNEVAQDRDYFMQGMSIKNILSNTNATEKDYVMYELANASENKIHEGSFKVAGISDEIADFKKSDKFKNISNGKKALDNLMLMKEPTVEDFQNLIMENGGYSQEMESILRSHVGNNNNDFNQAIEVCMIV